MTHWRLVLKLTDGTWQVAVRVGRVLVDLLWWLLLYIVQFWCKVMIVWMRLLLLLLFLRRH